MSIYDNILRLLYIKQTILMAPSGALTIHHETVTGYLIEIAGEHPWRTDFSVKELESHGFFIVGEL